MKTLLSFLAGASLVFMCCWFALESSWVGKVETIALALLAGIILGSWLTGLAMFLFAHLITNYLVVPRTDFGTGPTQYFDLDACADARNTPDQVRGVDIDENDVNWWKHGKKPFGEAA
jgi:hypothetical protein